MVYLNTIPAANDDPSDSQSQLLENFAQLNTQFSTDHIALIAGANNGEHKKVTLNDVFGAHAAPVDPKTLIFTEAVAAISELFFENANGKEQLTNLTVTTTASQHHIVTPWGMEFDFGRAAAGVGLTTINYETAFPTNIYTNVVSIVAQNSNGRVAWWPEAAAANARTRFQVYSSAVNQISYFAIGF